ncbi:MAG: hypothetical protein JST93_05985 [Acidobacteria bacterium]|nr:hypothetical protein [Acidobacteriota bacterium]
MERRFLWMLFLGAAAFAQAPLPPACAPYPNGCLYSPGPAGNFSTVNSTISYRDVTERPRVLPIFVRVPSGIQGPLPLVVWSADEATSDPRTSISAWSEATARAGYLTVTVAHTPRTTEERTRFCTAAGLDEPICATLNPLLWDGPQDLKQVLDFLEELNATGPPEIRNRIDMKRIALAGHGYGSNGSMSLLGAQRILVEGVPPFDFSDPRPAAVIALSPYGPTQGGMFDTDVGRNFTSWTTLERPALTITGAGDNDCVTPGQCFTGDSPSRRRIPFDLMPRGAKYDMFVRSVEMSHDHIGALDSAACAAQGVPQARCANFENWLRAAVLAFLDAQLRSIPAARNWLQNDLVQPASANGVIWRKK